MTAMSIFHTAHLRVREDFIEQFRHRLLRHARISLDAEPGCHRFDIHQETNDPALFLLIEIYANQAAFETHRVSPHYLQFREDVKDWIVERKWWYWRQWSAS
jgi:(4S)-4-hydroxy-5-phosphonooxypentane-2,3-dione isomerase